jgi:hypothetical protein
MSLAIQNRRISATPRKHMVAGLVLLSSMLVSDGARADLNDRSASAFGQSAPTRQESNAASDQRFLALFRAASLSLTQAIAIAERSHAGSRTAAITFDISGPPAYRVRTVKNKEIWENGQSYQRRSGEGRRPYQFRGRRLERRSCEGGLPSTATRPFEESTDHRS